MLFAFLLRLPWVFVALSKAAEGVFNSPSPVNICPALLTHREVNCFNLSHTTSLAELWKKPGRPGKGTSSLLSSGCRVLAAMLSARRQISPAQKCHWTQLINSFMQSCLLDLACDMTRNRALKHVVERILVMPSCTLNLMCPRWIQNCSSQCVFPLDNAMGSVSSLGHCYATEFYLRIQRDAWKNKMGVPKIWVSLQGKCKALVL